MPTIISPSPGLYPTYFLHLEREKEHKPPVFMLAGRKRKKCTSSTYLLSTDPTDLSREGEVATLRSNMMGTSFTLSRSDMGEPSPRPCSSSGGSCSPASWEEQQEEPGPELAAILYKPNVLGTSGPRKMRVLLPRGSRSRGKTLLDSYKERETEGVLVLASKEATWDAARNSYVLNYHGRASQASVKNFQICHHSNTEFIIMQLGRVDTNIFSMDFRWKLQ